MFEAIRFILVDLFSSARSMLQAISFGDFDLYSFFISCLMIAIIFKLSVIIFGGGKND